MRSEWVEKPVGEAPINKRFSSLTSSLSSVEDAIPPQCFVNI